MASNKELQDMVAERDAQIVDLQAQLAAALAAKAGGKGSGKKWTDEQKAAHSEKMKASAHKWTPEEREKLSATLKEKSHKWTPEEKAQLSANMKAAFAAIKSGAIQAPVAQVSNPDAVIDEATPGETVNGEPEFNEQPNE